MVNKATIMISLTSYAHLQPAQIEAVLSFAPVKPVEHLIHAAKTMEDMAHERTDFERGYGYATRCLRTLFTTPDLPYQLAEDGKKLLDELKSM